MLVRVDRLQLKLDVIHRPDYACCLLISADLPIEELSSMLCYHADSVWMIQSSLRTSSGAVRRGGCYDTEEEAQEAARRLHTLRQKDIRSNEDTCKRLYVRA